MRVAAIQLNAGSDKKRNVAKAMRFIQAAVRNGARLICLPEVFNYRGSLKELATISETIFHV